MDIPKKMPCVDVNDAYAHVVNKFQCNILVMDISPTAYSKIFSHAVKYPTSTIGGYLIGTKSTTTMKIIDAIPINHELPVGPILEIAADIISSKLSESADAIIGYYFSLNDPHLIQQNEYPKYIKGIKDAIFRNAGHCTILQINDKLINSRDHLCLQTQGRFNIAPLGGMKMMNAIIDTIVDKKLYLRISDFEDYFNSSAKDPADYNNEYLNKLIDSFPSST